MFYNILKKDIANMGATQRIAERLKALRTEKNMTQGEVAEKAGINTNYYAKVERGEVTASIPMLEKIAVVLEADIASIFLAK